jgi:hypothetical protein
LVKTLANLARFVSPKNVPCASGTHNERVSQMVHKIINGAPRLHTLTHATHSRRATRCDLRRVARGLAAAVFGVVLEANVAPR